MQNPDTVVNLALLFLAIAWLMSLFALFAIVVAVREMKRAKKLYSISGALLVLAVKIAATQQVVHLYHYTSAKLKGLKQ